MAEGQHTDDLRNVRENDTVEITTTLGETFEAECETFERQNAAPESGEIRETFIWQFEYDGDRIAATILEGLKSSPDDPDFPQHSEMWNMDAEENMGYIEDLSIYDEIEA